MPSPSIDVDDTTNMAHFDAVGRGRPFHRFRSIVENIPAVVCLKDLGGRFQVANDRLEEWYGISVDSALGRTSSELFPPALADICESLDRQALESGALREREMPVPFTDGSNHSILMMKFPVLGKDREPVGVGTINMDLTELRQAEKHLLRAQKLEVVGQLTGGIAHDFNNLLSVIQGHAELFTDGNGQGEESARMVIRAATRGAELTRKLLAFSRQQSLQPRSIDIAALVNGMSNLLSRILGETIDVCISAKPGIWPAHADSGQVENALLNLAINACDAMPEGGRLTITIQNTHLDAASCTDDVEAQPGDYVVLIVNDTGEGMSADISRRAFDPFFTTKGVGQGSGLGLSMVYGFARQTGGYATIDSVEGRGTTVKLFLPRSTGVPSGRRETGAGEEPLARGESVLVLEDDADVRALTVLQLESIGYTVQEACDARTALNILGSNGGVDLLLSDIVLPGKLNGPKLAEEARRWCPSLKVVFMSGYAPNTLLDEHPVNQNAPLLQKPISKAVLAKTLRQVFDG